LSGGQGRRRSRGRSLGVVTLGRTDRETPLGIIPRGSFHGIVMEGLNEGRARAGESRPCGIELSSLR
jgi:hypothetical protein